MESTGKRSERSVTSRLLEKALMPIVATAATAAASYAAKKAPQVIETKVVPKAHDLMSGAGDVARDLPGKAKSAAGDAGDVAEQLTDRVKSVAGGARAAQPGKRKKVTSAELERRTKERARHRSARRKASR